MSLPNLIRIAKVYATFVVIRVFFGIFKSLK